ncbi:MAG: Basal-body rod modification protein FlgD [Pelotomaculum sp. PtaU1.Bin035]|nr:MAG: Basal-body rod modification protein FlgD [Pelotomaculum sp. PtaU1.Bin035]
MGVTATTATESYQKPPDTTRQPVKTLDKDAFLQLLVTQLKNQDPTSPQDTNAFVSEMAQLSMLEQLSNLNDEIKQLRSSQEMSEASALIGHQVIVQSDDGEISGQVEKVSLASNVVKVFVNGTGYELAKVTEVK